MAISFVARASDLSGTRVGTTVTVNMPSGYAAGDVLLIGMLVPAAPTTQQASPPAGWNLLVTQLSGTPFPGGGGFPPSQGELRIYYKIATGAEGSSQAFNVVANGGYPWTALAYRGTAVVAPQGAGNTSGGTSVASWTSPTHSAAVEEWAVSILTSGNGLSGNSKDGSSNLRSATVNDQLVVLDRITGPGATSGSTLTMGSAQQSTGVTAWLRPLNSAPYAPTLNSPVSGSTIDVAIDNYALFTFNDPDFDLPRPEGQSKFDIRARIVGVPTWTDDTVITADEFYLFPGGGFTPSDIEWQVRCYDLAGVVGPWSTSGFFTVAVAPAPPAITDPTLDEEITSNTFNVTWSVTTQTAYQIRTVADDAGVPDTTDIYYDSGTIADGAARAAMVPFFTNNRTEHVQVRVWDGTLWSPWDSVRVDIAFVQPPTPYWTSYVDAATASINVNYTTPAPVGDQPDPHHVELEINDGGDYTWEVKKWTANLPLNGIANHPTIVSGRDYTANIRVYSVTVDGIRSEVGINAPNPALASWYEALTERASAPVNVIYHGASLAEGWFVTDFSKTVGQQLASKLRTRLPFVGQPAGGRGNLGIPTPGSALTDYVFTGGSFDYIGTFDVGLNYTAWLASVAGEKAILTLDTPVTSFDIMHMLNGFGHAAGGYYKIDGGAAVTFNTLGANAAERRHVPLPATTTIEVGSTGTGYYVHKDIVEYGGDETKGIRVYDSGHAAFTLAEWSTGSPADTIFEATAGYDPNLWIIADFPVNDAIAPSGSDVATAKAALLDYLADGRAAGVACPILLVGVWNIESYYPFEEPWAAYMAMMQEVADEDPSIAFIDAGAQMPAMGSSAIYSGDFAHAAPSGDAYEMLAEIIADFISPE